MGVERYVVDAVVLEGCSRREAARRAGVSKGWVDELVSRYRTGGYEALEPRSRRPKSCKHAVALDTQAAIIQLRKELDNAGHDCGPHTVHYHLSLTRANVPSVATIWRILKRHGLITPQPQKQPKSSFIRFEAALPNEMWQGDYTHWHLADGTAVEILNYLDDHSRFLMACDAFYTVKGLDVVRSFHIAAEQNGFPASLLTDNGAVFTGKLRKGKVLLESELERLGITYKNSRPYHPQTCGKVERFHQTLKRWLKKQAPARTLAELQLQLDTFRTYYNNVRPHRALNKQTPLQAFNARLKAHPLESQEPRHFRVRHDHVDKAGRVTLRYMSRLHHIGIGKLFRGQPVTLLIANKHIRVLDQNGALLRELILDPTRDYQPTGKPFGPPPKLGRDDLRHVAGMT